MSYPHATACDHVVDPIKADIRESVLLGHPITDNLVSCVLALAAELWAVRRRMLVLQAVLVEHGVPETAIETYVPSEVQQQVWERDRDRFIQLTLGAFADQGVRSMADFPKHSCM